MAPFLPLVSLNRSQNVRIGHGPNAKPPSIGASAGNPQTGAIPHLFYADLSDGNVRKDIQHHTTLGAVLAMGTPSNTVWSDLFQVSGLGVSAGTGYALTVASGVFQSRFYQAKQTVGSAQTVTPAAPTATSARTDLVVIDAAGVASIVQGAPAGASAVYEVDTVAITGTPTAGTFTLSFTYDGFNYTTAAIAYNATASAVASAVLAATGGPALPAGTLTGSGGPLPATVTLTASGALEGPITNQAINISGLTGATGGTFGQTTAGTGVGLTGLGGGVLPLASVFIPSGASSAAGYTITEIALTS